MIDRFKQGFFEEARELLVGLESALLELDRKRDDPELVGAAFRALHTIKGSGAMFGFDDIAGFAHNVETVFDRLRKGQLTPTTDLINLALAAGDQIKSMLDESAGVGSADPGRSANILAELGKLTGSQQSDGQPAAAPPPVEAATADRGEAADWLIHFRPGPNVLLNGTNPLLLFGELRELGQLRIQCDTSAVPPLRELDPERCYTAWDMVLTTGAGRDAIRDVFVFVEDDSELKIEAGSDATRIPGAGAANTPEAGKIAAAKGPSNLRVSAEKLDQLVNLVGELVTVQARLSEVSARRDDPEILAISEEIDRLTAELRENSMSIRMLPLRTPSNVSAGWCTI